MRYLGDLRGDGILICGEAKVGHASYEFDGFVSKGGQLSGSGEIRVAPETLEKVFGHSNLRLQTDDGQSLSFRFSEKELQHRAMPPMSSSPALCHRFPNGGIDRKTRRDADGDRTFFRSDGRGDHCLQLRWSDRLHMVGQCRVPPAGSIREFWRKR